MHALAFYVMKAKEINKLDLSRSETREIITPYAFKINEQLLGLPLASPTRRGLAMLVDISLIFLAAKLSAALIAFVAAMAFYRGTAETYLPKMSGWVRRTLKIFAASILFIASLSLLSEGIDYFDGQDNVIAKGISNEVNLTAFQKEELNKYLRLVEGDGCDEACITQAETELLTHIPALAKLEKNENQQLNYLLLKLIAAADKQAAIPNASLSEVFSAQPQEVVAVEKADKVSYSIIEWVKGIMSDLGLGLGWAAVYFTLFPLLWRGQTPGKKLLNIRVVALSGEYLSLWDAFGRYGGYGAGFATGLLGFLQIVWDPNRQAIQDKISATVVIHGPYQQVVTPKTIAAAIHE